MCIRDRNYTLPYYTLSPTYSICSEHGYLTGEQKVCPKCGRVTEVWSRITGYYRPVQNWNDGKAQEFENRTEYDLSHSVLKHPSARVVTLSDYEKNSEVKIEAPEGVKYLFTTKTCPNCRLAKEYLKNENYIPIDAEENAVLASKYGVMQAPTLVVVNGEEFRKITNVSNIKKYAEQKEAVNA